MTGSVTGGAQSDEPKSDGKLTDEKKTQPQQQQSSSASSSAEENADTLPPIETLSLKKTTNNPSSSSPPSPETSQLQPPTPPPRKKPPVFNRCASSLPAVAKKMDEGAAGSLARYGRAQSVLTLYTKPPAAAATSGEDGRSLDDSRDEARSELGGPASSRRRRREPVRAYGTLERATSYGSLTASSSSRPHFRTANSTRPRPAPPCTTTHLDYGPRHPVNHHHHHSATGSLRRAVGTPRRNNPHPVGLHFQSPYNRDGKTFEVWSPDESVISNHLPQMCRHMEQTNFTCGKTQPYPSHPLSPDLHPHRGDTVYRSSYRNPQASPDHDLSLPTTRYGSTRNRVAAIGVVPNVMSHHCAERRVRLHVPRGQKLETLV